MHNKNTIQNSYSDLEYFQQGKFTNYEYNYKIEFFKTLNIIYEGLTKRSAESFPKNELDIPVKKIDHKTINNIKDNSVIRLGHSTLLIKIQNNIFLTDPVFSDRVSPLSWIGPKRFHNPPISIEELPEIKGIIISHNHYDHLDKKSIQKLNNKTEMFFVPLGVGKYLKKFGIKENKIQELRWWEETYSGNIKIVSTPAQHFSGRGLFDFNKSSWSSWVIQSPEISIFFSGDSGYFKGFKTIGEKYGPFHMTFLDTGAYNHNWKELHMMPEETIKAHKDLKGKTFIPIHNGTFDLSTHSWYEPFVTIDKLAVTENIKVEFPEFGEIISILKENKTIKWFYDSINNDKNKITREPITNWI